MPQSVVSSADPRWLVLPLFGIPATLVAFFRVLMNILPADAEEEALLLEELEDKAGDAM